MLMYFPCKMMGKKFNTIMWVQSSWTVTVAQHCCIPIGRIKFWWGKRPPRKWSPPQWQTKDTVLDYRIPGCYQKTATSKRKKFRFPKHVPRMLTNIQAVVKKKVQSQTIKLISHLRRLCFWVTMLDLLMWRPHKYLWGQGVVDQQFQN